MQVKIKEVMASKGISMYQINKETSIASSTLSKLCNKHTSRIDFKTIDILCSYLKCDISDILVPDKINFPIFFDNIGDNE